MAAVVDESVCGGWPALRLLPLTGIDGAFGGAWASEEAGAIFGAGTKPRIAGTPGVGARGAGTPTALGTGVGTAKGFATGTVGRDFCATGPVGVGGRAGVAQTGALPFTRAPSVPDDGLAPPVTIFGLSIESAATTTAALASDCPLLVDAKLLDAPASSSSGAFSSAEGLGARRELLARAPGVDAPVAADAAP